MRCPLRARDALLAGLRAPGNRSAARSSCPGRSAIPAGPLRSPPGQIHDLRNAPVERGNERRFEKAEKHSVAIPVLGNRAVPGAGIDDGRRFQAGPGKPDQLVAFGGAQHALQHGKNGPLGPDHYRNCAVRSADWVLRREARRFVAVLRRGQIQRERIRRGRHARAAALTNASIKACAIGCSNFCPTMVSTSADGGQPRFEVCSGSSSSIPEKNSRRCSWRSRLSRKGKKICDIPLSRIFLRAQ